VADPGSSDSGAVTLTYIDPARLITMAYGVNAYQIAGPDWLRSERFDIAARPPGTTVEQYRMILQNLLAACFKQAVPREQREGRGFDLVVAKDGPTLKDSTAPASGRDGSRQPAFGLPVPPRGCTGPLTFLVANCSMDQIAAAYQE
jgi:uncharacterized protein (TIGR03435 family)